MRSPDPSLSHRQAGRRMGGQASNCDVHSRDNAKAQGVLGGKSVTEPGPDLFQLWPMPKGNSQRAPDGPGSQLCSFLGKSNPAFPSSIFFPVVFQVLGI